MSNLADRCGSALVEYCDADGCCTGTFDPATAAAETELQSRRPNRNREDRTAIANTEP
jgi:hypothetical protein